MSDIKNLRKSHNRKDEDTLELVKTAKKAHRDLLRIKEGDQMDNATIILLIE